MNTRDMFKPYVLRDTRTGIIINSAYSPEGLYWTTDNAGRLLCFRNAQFRKIYNTKTGQLTHLRIVGDTRFNPLVYIDKLGEKQSVRLAS